MQTSTSIRPLLLSLIVIITASTSSCSFYTPPYCTDPRSPFEVAIAERNSHHPEWSMSDVEREATRLQTERTINCRAPWISLAH